MNRRTFLGFGAAAIVMPAIPVAAAPLLHDDAASRQRFYAQSARNGMVQTTVIRLQGDRFNRAQVRALIEQLNAPKQ